MLADDAPKPNILIILADDLGYADIGVHGCQDIPTPQIDSIARNGVRCTNAYVSSSMCSPSRAGLLTGRSQSRFGHEINFDNALNAESLGLPVGETTFADLMRSGGYNTGIVGKWHLGNAEQFHPRKRGFDEFFGFLGGNHSYFEGISPPKGNRGALEANGEPFTFDGYLTDILGDAAADFVHRHRRDPWFLFLSFNAPHVPLQATQPYLDRVSNIRDPRRRTYAAMVVAMDDAIGRVLEQLRQDGIEENTLIVFLSDNGGPLERNGSRNDPLSGEKGTMLEGGIRVPLLVQWRGQLHGGQVYDRPVNSLDLLPTALAAADIPRPEVKPLDGVDLLPYLAGENDGDPHVAMFWRMSARNVWAARSGSFKLVMQRAKRGKHPGGDTPRLIDLATDIQEQHDLTEQLPERRDQLLGLYQAWTATLPAPLWHPEKTANTQINDKKDGKKNKSTRETKQ